MATDFALGQGRPPARFALDRTILALAMLNFFLADARDGLGPFLDAFLATQGWSTLTLGLIATVGGLIGLAATPLAGALVDASHWKRALIAGPVVLITATALLTLTSPSPSVVWIGQVGTAVIGAVVGPALAGLTLGIVGEKRFSDQIARNELWNHSGNLVTLLGIFVLVSMYGHAGVIFEMIATAAGAIAAVAAIDPNRIDHDVARGLAEDDGEPGPSGFGILARTPGLILMALILLVFHWGNAPMSRLIAQQFSIELGTPFRTTAIITGVSQLTSVFVAAAAPFLIRRIGLANVFLIGLLALPLRGLLAGAFHGFWVVYPVQALDGVGGSLIGIATPVAAERLLAGTGRFNVGLAAVMTMQGIGASLSNVVAGWLVTEGGYGASHFLGGGVALLAVALFLACRSRIVPPSGPAQGPAAGEPATPQQANREPR